MRGSFSYEPYAYIVREKACILADDKEMHAVIFLRGTFREVRVPEGKGVRVHDNGSDASGVSGRRFRL